MRRNYTETETFKKEISDLKKAGIPEKRIQEHIQICAQFDENGMEVDSNYEESQLAFPHPIS